MRQKSRIEACHPTEATCCFETRVQARARARAHTHTHTKASQPAEKRAIVEGDDAHWAAVDPEQRLQLGPVG